MKCLQEAITNALLHRDYSAYMQNRPVELKLFPDRIEIVSPGGLFGLATVDDLYHGMSHVRNPVMVSIMRALSTSEEPVGGIHLMNAELHKLGVPSVQFRDDIDSVTTTIFLLKPTLNDSPLKREGFRPIGSFSNRSG